MTIKEIWAPQRDRRLALRAATIEANEIYLNDIAESLSMSPAELLSMIPKHLRDMGTDEFGEAVADVAEFIMTPL